MNKEIYNSFKLLIHAKEDFLIGRFKETHLNDKNNIVLNKGALEGYFISPVINCSEFRELITSWNAYTSEDSYVEIQIKIRKKNQWSGWFSSGKWSVNEKRGSIGNQQNEFGKMDDECLVVLGEKAADAFKYKIILTRENAKTDSPEVKLIAASLKLIMDSDKDIFDISNKEWLKELDVPGRAQLSIPDIGNNICSPTSLSMVMEYYGYNYDTEYVASHVKDNGAGIYGNWAFNTAFLGGTDLYGYVARFETINEIKKMISMDMPAVVSIRTESKEELNGAIMAYPSGHLMVIRGFKIKDGNEYVIANDPAEYKEENVRREYKIEDFNKVWRRIAYVISPELKKLKTFCR